MFVFLMTTHGGYSYGGQPCQDTSWKFHVVEQKKDKKDWNGYMLTWAGQAYVSL